LGQTASDLEQSIEELWKTLEKCEVSSTEPLPDKVCAGSLGKTRDKRNVRFFFFPGREAARALVLAGVHGSELSGIEVAKRLAKRLYAESRQGRRPWFNTVIVPELFPDNAARARQKGFPPGRDSNIGRYTLGDHCPKRVMSNGKESCVDPNRQFPTPGRPVDFVFPLDALGGPIEPENVMLLRLIDRFEPSRIASVHAHSMPDPKRDKEGKDRNIARPGIFADPHTVSPPAPKAREQEAVRRTLRDCRLALDMARRFVRRYNHLSGRKDGKSRIPGNWLGSKNETCTYGSKAFRQCGISLGGWGPRAIWTLDPTSWIPLPRMARDSITVITVEVRHYYSSAVSKRRAVGREKSAYARHREKELEAHAAALRGIFLEHHN
jgi:hypothetical protein